MAKKFVYQCQTLGLWSETNSKEAMLNLLEVMVSALWFMEDDGSLQKMLCTVAQPCLDPVWVKNAAQCADPSFRRAGLKAGEHVLAKIRKLPPTHGAFRKMARLGAVNGETAALFERELWAMLVNHCFLRDSYTVRFGRNPRHFLGRAVDALKACALDPDEEWLCPHCDQFGEAYDQLVASHKSILQ